jgi:hypothetical protein
MNENPVVIEASKRTEPTRSHKLVVENGQVICVSCESKHTVNIDPSQLAVEGYLVIESN